MNIPEIVIDKFASDTIIDLYFILSDLEDIPISEQERTLSNCYDAAAGAVGDGDRRGVPLGKRVE